MNYEILIVGPLKQTATLYIAKIPWSALLLTLELKQKGYSN